MVLQYATDSGTLMVALTLRHTVLPDVIMSCEFWVFLGIHLAIYISSWAGFLDFMEAHRHLGTDFNIVKISTGMVAFFEVFYANQCYARYMALYKTTKVVLADACHYAYMLRLHLLRSPGYMRLSCRYMLLCLVVHFMHIQREQVTAKHLPELVTAGLLRPSELEALRCQPSSRWTIIILGWSNDVAARGCEKVSSTNPLAQRGFTHMTRLLLKINDGLLKINNLLTLPIPFQYFHLLCLLVVGTILLWAYAFGVTESFFSPIAFFLCTMILLSTMRLSSALADPFGDDEVDFPMQKWLCECAEIMEDITRSEFVDGRETVEQLSQLEAMQPRLGRILALRLQGIDKSAGGLNRERTDTSVMSNGDSEALELLGPRASARGSRPPPGSRSPPPESVAVLSKPAQWGSAEFLASAVEQTKQGSPRSCERVCGNC